MKKRLKWSLAQKAELKWWGNYLARKDMSDYHAWKRKYWQQILNKLADECPIKTHMDVLDAGCGPAGMFMVLQNCKVDAVDPLIDSYEINLAHFKRSDYPHVTFFSSPLEKFDTQKKYDLIFCMNAINHVADIKGCYDLLTSLLKENGRLVVSIDAHNFSFFKYLFGLIPGDILHPHQYNLKEYGMFLTERNLKILKTQKLKDEFFFTHYVQVGVLKLEIEKLLFAYPEVKSFNNNYNPRFGFGATEIFLDEFV